MVPIKLKMVAAGMTALAVVLATGAGRCRESAKNDKADAKLAEPRRSKAYRPTAIIHPASPTREHG